MSSLLTALNPEQLEAVTLPHQSALVLAGAGSGKTRVLTTRIAYLIQSGEVSPHGILAVTFTNKAAKEMLTRITAMLPINTRGMWIGTFHGLCNRLLRAHHQDAGLPQVFQILDSADQLAVIKRILKNLGADDEKFPPRQVQWFINNAKEEGLRASQVEAYDDYTRKMIEFYASYEQQCNKEGVVDFAELLLRSYELLMRNEIVRELAAPLASGRGWMKFLGILSIVSGALGALSIVGLIWAWLPIWLGVLLFQAASGVEQAAISGDATSFVTAQNRLRLYFMINGVMIIVAFALVVLFLIFGGMALLAALATHHASPTL